MHYILLCRSMTAAQSAVRLLQRSGIFSSVTKAPQSANPGGCTYGVKLGERNLTRAKELLDSGGLAYGPVFALNRDGSVREVRV